MEPEKKEEQKPEPTADEHHVKSLRTYQGDIEEALAKNNGSISSVVIAEQKRREKTLDEPVQQAKSQTRNKFFLFIGIILALIGIISVAIVYSYVTGMNHVVVVQKVTTPITYSQEDDLPVALATRATLVATLQKETQSFA